jgi:polysaccharide biosynthesis/export protein
MKRLLQGVLVLAGLIAGAGSASWAQDNSPPTQSTANKLTDMPLPNSLGQDNNRVFSPSRIFGNNANGRYGLDLKERPASGPPELKLQTSVETKVENKTTNYVGGGGGGGWGCCGPGPEPAPRPQGGGAPPTYGLEFPDWVRQSVGGALQVFGSELMGESGQGSPIDPMTVPADYRVGPGDELLIRAWGQIDVDYQGQIDRSGQIFIPKIGPMVVAGMPVEKLNEHIRTTFEKQYRNFELTVTLGKLRQIQFYVMGFVKKPGVYAAPSTSSLLYGLMTSGGAQQYGDLRKIELRRGGKTVAVVDAYRFLIQGKRDLDPQLLPGDVIFVPPSKGYAAMAGSVKRPAIFHLDDRTTIDDLLHASGGTTLNRSAFPLRIERMVGERRIVEHVQYSPSVGGRLIQDGELVMVLPVSSRLENAVTLRGHVASPLRNAWSAGMRVSDLLGSNDDLVRIATWAQRNERENLIKLGDARRDNDFKRDFPDVEWDYAAIERIDPSSLSASILTFNLRKALDKDPSSNLLLQPGDTVIVFAQADFKQPQHKKYKMVRVEGEVKVPGVYPVSEGETLKQALQRAGGLTTRAYVYGTVFTRMSAKRTEEERMRQAVDRVEQDYHRYMATRARFAVSQEEAMVGSTEYDAVRQLIGRLRAVQAQGRIPLNLNDSDAAESNYPELVLEDEDGIFVPNAPATVTVVGAVFQEGSQLWVRGGTVSSYIDGAGGLRDHADGSGMVVMRADGTVRQVGGWWGRSTNVYPGDTILVPEDVRTVSWTKWFKDWSQIFYQMGLGGAALVILKKNGL